MLRCIKRDSDNEVIRKVFIAVINQQAFRCAAASFYSVSFSLFLPLFSSFAAFIAADICIGDCAHG